MLTFICPQPGTLMRKTSRWWLSGFTEAVPVEQFPKALSRASPAPFLPAVAAVNDTAACGSGFAAGAQPVRGEARAPAARLPTPAVYSPHLQPLQLLPEPQRPAKNCVR